MCGRFALTSSSADVSEVFSGLDLDDFPARYNIAPTQPILVVISGEGRERGSNLADLSAFNFLYPLANKAMIARIERPALPREDLEAMGRALSRLQVDNGVAVIHLGEINREDVIPQLAEFCLQIEGVDWSVVSGLVKDRVVISVRNVGYVKSAGEIMKRLYDDIGSAGGHRAMAKAVVPLDRFKQRFGEVSEKVIREAMLPMIVDRDQIELELH